MARATSTLKGKTGAAVGVAAAAGLVAGLAANVGRKVAVQAASGLSGDWLDALKTEHKMALGIFDLIQATSDKQKAKRSTLLMTLKHALGKHAFQEENVIYPALRNSGEADTADQLNDDHGYVKQYLYDLENLPKDSPGFLSKVAEFRADLEKHIREEEDDIFPSLQAKLTEEQNKKVTLAMNKEGFKLA